MLQDLRYAMRTLLKSPGYTLVAMLALGLGIGANTAIFSFVDVLLLRPLPYPHADRLYVPVSIHPGRGFDRASVTYADYLDWQREADLFDAVAVFQPTAATITGGTGDPARVDAIFASKEYFGLVDVRALAGRVLIASDHAADAPPVAVLGYGVWQQRFGGDPAVVGRDVGIGGVPHTIVGVLGPRAAYPETTQVFLPLRVPDALSADLQRRDNMIFQAVARLAAGATRDQAEARMRAIAQRLEQEFPESRKGWSNGLVSLRDYIVESELSTALYVLLAAVGAVLLIACANLANLTLVRGAGRARELGVRVAIGASRGRLVRQLAAESLILAAAGGVLGIAAGSAAMRALVAIVPPDTPFVQHVELDGRVMLAAAALTMLTVLLVGLLPAFSASGLQVIAALRDGGRGASQGRHTVALRHALVIAEIALAVVLLVAAGLLIRSLERVTDAPPGADIERVLAGRLALPSARYSEQQRVDFYRVLLARLATQPGVESAAVTSYLPVGGGGFGLGRVFLAEGRPEPPAGVDVQASWTVVTPDYFRTLGIPLLAGRAFEDRDSGDTAPVIIVSASFAARMFGPDDPIGRRVRSWRDENLYREIVGVVADVPFASLTDRNRALVYVPHAQQGWGGMIVALRAAGGAPDQLAPVLRHAVRTLDPELALAGVGTMDVFARHSIARERLSATLMGVLSALALALAVLGIYGIMSYSVAARRQEIGVRLALGAAPGDVYRLVLQRGLVLTAVGLAIGLAGAIASTGVLQSLLHEIDRFDPVTFAAMALVLSGTALVACVLPARRAAQADPLMALRAE